MTVRIRSLAAHVRGLALGAYSPYSLRHIVQQAGWAGIAVIGGLVVRWALFLLIARLLGPLGLGLYALALAFGNGVAILASAGTDQALLRYLPKYRARGEREWAAGVILFAVGLTACLGLVTAAALFVLAPHLAAWWGQPELERAVRLIAVAVPAIALSWVFRAGLQAFHDVRLAMALDRIVVPAATAGGLVLILVLRPDEPTAAVAAGVAAFWLAALTAGGAMLGKARQEMTRPAFRPVAWARFALPMSLDSGLLFLVTWTDQLMLGWFAQADDVGVYTAAARVARLVTVPLQAVNAIFPSTVAGLSGRQDRATLQRLYAILTWSTALAGGSIGAALWLNGPWILRALGPEFSTGYVALAILVAGQMVNVGTGSSGVVLGMSGFAGWRLANTASAAGLNVLLNALLIPQYGIQGAAVATTVALSAVQVLQVVEVRWLTGLRAYDTTGLRWWRSPVGRRSP